MSELTNRAVHALTSVLSHLEPDDPRRWRLEQVLTALEHLSDQPNPPSQTPPKSESERRWNI